MASYNDFYWSKLEKGELWLQFCPACKEYIFYPRSICPHCLMGDWEWQQLEGKGKIYSYTTICVSSLPEFANDVPYVYAIVELNEGIRIPANILNCPLEQLRVELPLELMIVNKGGKKLPAFQPAKD
ncbi:MAG: OB-fold domain-containing protein [Syntrophomonadaceae bacterium]|nr:OB-fold domain-containing protein [Syntrophomonadaceae bacterium]MDD3022303.1 OB-fold domain-containing protein [Syntrophomonadaceae bacterium]